MIQVKNAQQHVTTVRSRFKYSLCCSVEEYAYHPQSFCDRLSPLWLALGKVEGAGQSCLPVIHRNPGHRYSHSTNLDSCFSQGTLHRSLLTDGRKAGLPESKPKQNQNLVLWIVLWENLPSGTTEKAEGVPLVCLGDCNFQHHNYFWTPVYVPLSVGSSFLSLATDLLLGKQRIDLLFFTLLSFTFWSPQPGKLNHWHRCQAGHQELGLAPGGELQDSKINLALVSKEVNPSLGGLWPGSGLWALLWALCRGVALEASSFGSQPSRH